MYYLECTHKVYWQEQEIDRLSTYEKEKEFSSMSARNRETIAGRRL